MKTEIFFRKIEKAQRPVVVDVWAPWCAPCRRMEPLLEELQEVYAGRVDVLKVNADESQPLVKQLGVLGIPTTIVYRDGREIGRRTGALGRSDLTLMFDAALSDAVMKIPAMSRRTRIIRLALAAIAFILGFVLTPGWPLFVVAAALLLLAFYDYIPGVREFRDRMILKLLNAAAESRDEGA